ncbi:hypothetical protein NW752_006751 [Fusarium irregulare]|uniref:Uncharacterized protein n=1 Tax=Fusarium irregulare TaxID=2494466 RepID=A0A9W8PRR0_9HYPO|nr:hypothetical protein NW766_005631 [Fusarium irregulare]KAJ4015826.1 hypothetical protein NW752_006751 [Fusarium irregulare]
MPNVRVAAKPTVRLKCPNGTYKETQEGELFEAHGGGPEDLMDEERWLSTPAGLGDSPWTSNISEDSSPRGLRGIAPDHSSRDADGSVSGRIIWSPAIPESRDDTTPRKVNSQHIVFKHVARACNAEEGNSETKGVFVGLSAIDCMPIVLVRDRQQATNRQDGTDSMNGVKLKYPDDFPGGADIIWLENMLIPGNIAHVRSALMKNLDDVEKENFLRVRKRENDLLGRGLNPAGVALSLPSSQDPKRQPSICRPIHPGRNYNTLHYQLRWPPMAALEFPTEMVEAMVKFLDKHPHDNVPLNIALAAAIIFIDLSNEGWQNEGFMSSGLSQVKPIRPASLGQFVLYFPHMLRYVETKHLTAFIHPARFAAWHYYKDGKQNKETKIESTAIDAKKMKVWCTQIRSRYPQVPKDYRFNLIPASMPGSRMVFPSDRTIEAPPTTSLFRMCCLDDIQTLGLPIYRYTSQFDTANEGKFRLLGGPEWLFCKRTQPHSFFLHDETTLHNNAFLHGEADVDYWKPSTHTRFMALTGQARIVGPVFPDITSTYYIGNKEITHCVESHFGHLAYYTQDHNYHESQSGPIRSRRSARTTELLRLASYLEIPLDEIWECSETGCLTWNGKEEQLRDLEEKGTLKRIAEGDEVERPAKRLRTSERKLDGSAKAKIEDQLGSAAALSRDWEPLRVYLQGSGLTIEGARKSLSQVRSFIASVEKEFCSENATNGRGDLEEVIRLTFRAAGLELALAACENELARQKAMLTQLDQSIQKNMEHILELQPLRNGFLYALPFVEALSDSPLIQGQSALLKEIDALLGENTLRDES